jgi:hypothetical protein
VTCSVDYQLIVGQVYKLGTDGILCRCALEHEHDPILYESHEGIAGGHNAGKAIREKFLCARIWWPSLFVDAKEYCKCAMYVNVSGSLVEEMSSLCFWLQHWNHLRNGKLILWAPSILPCIRQVHYIIMATEYLMRWVEAASVKDCTTEKMAHFIFENVITRFSYPKVLMSDHGSHFLNETIRELTRSS